MKQFRAVSITTDGAATVHDWDVTHGTLKHLQEAVGGFVDVVALAPDMDMWVNDEGLVIGHDDLNHAGTPVRGRRARTVHPPSEEGPTVRSPSNTATRSRIPISPRPEPAASTRSTGTPRSRTSTVTSSGP